MSTAPFGCADRSWRPSQRLADPPLSGEPTSAHSDGDRTSSFDHPGPAGPGSNFAVIAPAELVRASGQLSDVVQMALVVATRWLPRAHQSAHRCNMQPSKYGYFRVARGGIEPPTYRFSGRRPILRYCPKHRICWENAPSVAASDPPGIARWLPPWLPRTRSPLMGTFPWPRTVRLPTFVASEVVPGVSQGWTSTGH